MPSHLFSRLGNRAFMVTGHINVERPEERRRAVIRLLYGVLHPLDVHVFTPKEFEETDYEELSFVWIIFRQARIYHWTDEGRLRVPPVFSNGHELSSR